MTASVKEPTQASTLMRVKDVAEELAISRSKVWDLLMKGDLKSVKFGSSRRIFRESLNRFVEKLAAQQQGGGPDETD